MKTLRSLLFLIAALFAAVPPHDALALNPGDIAFTGFNADGDDDLAFVALTSIAMGEVIYFSDEEWNGTDWATNTESAWTWTASGNIAAGTVVTIDKLSLLFSGGTTSNLGVIAAISDGTNNAGLGASDEAVFAFQSDGSVNANGVPNPTGGFLALIANEDAAGAGISLTGTGLSEGAGTAIIFTSDEDGMAYTGSRTGQTTAAGYLTLLADKATNWTTQASDGTLLLPFNTTAFSFPATVAINDVTLSEGDSGTKTFTFTVTRSDNTGTFSVDYATADDTATTADSDYVTASGTLNFTASGDLTDTIEVTVSGDTDIESNEAFFVNLSNLQSTVGSASISDAQGVGTISNDDVATTFFPQSVASGDPRSNSVVLWTRVVDVDTSTDRTVTLHLTSDAGTLSDVGTTTVLGGTNLWAGGNLTAESAHDGVVKLKVTGLTPDTTFYYQFTYNGEVSPIGRTRTAPDSSSSRTVRYAAVNCNDFVGRWFNSLKHLCDQEANNIDFVVNLGDYIYETTGDPSFQTTLPERAMVFTNPAEAIDLGGGNYAAQSLGNYRDIYKTIRQDEQLQRLHELFPMISIWDDHEFSDDNWQDNATYFDGRGDEQQTTRKRNGETAWMEFLPTERGLDPSNVGFDIDPADLYPNTNIQDVFNFGQALDLITTDIRTFRADHLIPEDAFPATIAMDEAAVIATLAAANGLDVPTFTAAVWPGLEANFAPYFDVNDGAYAAVKAGLEAIVAGGAATPLSNLPAGITPAYADGAAYASAKVTGLLDANFVNQLFLAAAQPAPFDATALAAMDRGLSFYLMGKTSFFSDTGSRYQVVDLTYQLYAGYTYQLFIATSGAAGRDQDFYGAAQLAFLSNALTNSTAAWPVVASSTPFTPIKLELGDLPAGVTLPTQGSLNGGPLFPATIPNEFLVEFLLNADEPAGFPQYRQGIIDLMAQHDAIFISGDIHAQLVGANTATNGQTVVDFTVPSAASSEFRRAVSGAFAVVEGLVGAQLGGTFVYDPAQKQAVIDATDAIIEHNTPEMFKADTAAHGYTVFTASLTDFDADYQKIDVSHVDDNLYAQSEAALDALFTTENFSVKQTGSGPDTDLLLNSFTLQLLHLADAEAGLLAPETAPNLAALVDAFDGTYANTIILAGGDNYIPGPFAAAGTDATVSATHTRGNNPFAADIEIHNRIGVQASTIGNHEFDFGTNAFSDAINDTTFPYLSANLDFTGDADISGRYQETVGTGGLEEASALAKKIVPSAVITVNGEKIGLVGATTQIVETIASTGNVEVKGFTGDGSETNDMTLLASQLQPVIDDLTSQGVNKIVLMAHLQQITFEQQLAPLLSGVDIILAAGSNTRLGDSDDVAVAFTGHAANFADTYPLVTAGADTKPVLIVNTDNEFTYLGRLIVDFTADGEIVTSGLPGRVAENGAYAATAANVAAAWGAAEIDLPTTAFASGTKGALVKEITDAVQAVITAKDGDVKGFTNVYLEGERAFVRNQETNLGNISADANAGALAAVPGETLPIVSLKNGGGIRAAIGSVEVGSGVKNPPLANPGASKPAGGVSLLDIENSMRFNNSLMAFDTTPAGLKAILEHGLAVLGNQGRFPQIGGMALSYDPALTAGSRILSIALIDDNGDVTTPVVQNGAVHPDAPATIRMVTLNFLANGGDSYPIKANGENFSFLLSDGTLSAPVDEALSFTSAANVPANVLGEQAAMSAHMAARYPSAGAAFDEADTPAASDLRIQDVSVRSDTVLDIPVNPTVAGSIGGSVSGGGSFTLGSTAQFTASADVGYAFTGWTVNGQPAGSANPLQVPVTAGMTVEATFGLLYPASNAITSNLKSSISLAGAEIPAFDPLSQRAFASSDTGIQVIDLADPANPVFISTIAPSTLGVTDLTSDDISSIAIRKGTGGSPSVLAAAVINSPKTANGHVVFLNAATGALLGSAVVGSVPDHIAFTPDGTKLLVCNEGEIDGDEDAIVSAETVPGSVSILDLTNIASPSVTTAGFASFNASAAALKAAGVRIFDGGTPEFDFEPEYLAISPDGTKAMVTLQEANAVAILDIATATFTSVVPLGEKDFSTLYADFSDRDGPSSSNLMNPTTGNPVFGLYMPDGIASYQVGGQTYYVTANEGDDRDDFLATEETIRVSSGSYDLDDTIFPDETTLKTNARLGRLTVSNAPGLRGDTEGDGDIDRILAYGARSFSILDSNGVQVFDSGDMLELIVATQFPALFDDGRSDNKGPEPEGVTVATINDRIFAFVGLERSHMTLAFDVTDPTAPTFATAFQHTGDLNPEGMTVVAAGDNPTGKPLLLVANEDSNTLSVFEINEPVDYKLQLLHFADGEAGLLAPQTAPNLAALVDAFEDTHANTIILTGGDNYIPGPFAAAGTDAAVAATHNKGNNPFAADIEIHNRIGVEASTIGNHEFDFGTNAFSDAINDTNFPYLSANLDFSGDSAISGRYEETVGVGGLEEASSLAKKIVPSCVITKGGQSIGLVGATTQILRAISSAGDVQVKGNPSGNDMALLASQLQPVIDDLTSQGVNKIILMAHLQQIALEQELAPLLSGVDIILAAGSNTRLGDADDVAVAFTGHAANFAANYPIYTADADGNPTVIVNTDNEFTYLGRLVADFDADGLLIVPNLIANTAENGAYAATAANVAAAWGVAEGDLATSAFADGTKGAAVKQITDAVQAVISAKDGDIRGYTNVYLEGERNFVRNQETNLGNISADSMITVGQTALPDAPYVVALKNGGGIRAAIGAVEVGSGAKLPPLANPGAGKPGGAISQLDIENSMRFNNGLMLCDTTPAGLKAILEHGVSAAGTGNGRFPQIGGILFSYDPNATAGSRVQSIALVDDEGNITARVVTGGNVSSDAPAIITLVTLNFLAQGGDSYPFKANADNFRFLLSDGTLSANIDEASSFTDAAVVPSNLLREQAALSSHLQANYGAPTTAYSEADTPPELDQRIVNLDILPDTVLAALLFDSDGDGLSDADEILLGSSEDSNLRIGDTVDLNVGAFAGVDQTVRVVGNLPTGLRFDPNTGRITGIIRGNPGLYDIQVQVLDANGLVVRTHNLRFVIQAFPAGLLAGYEALLMDAQDLPMGMLRLTLSRPGSWSASLQMKNLPTRTAKGVYTLTAGSPTAELTLPFRPRGAAPATEIVVNLDAAEVTFAGSVTGAAIDLAGLRLASRGAAPPAKRRLTMVLDQGEQDGINYPAGLGWARGGIATSGSLLLFGQLGDARPFTMSSKLAVTNQTLLWIQPYRNKDSYIGGVAPVPAVGQPAPAGAGLDEGLIWNKAADSRELAYPLGFAAPLPVTAHLSSQIPVRTSAELSALLGLTDNFIQLEIAGSELSTVPAVGQPLLPTQFLLNPNFTLTVTEPVGSVPLTGRNNRINKSSGGITGSMVLTAGSENLAGKASFSGVILQDASFGSTVGAGLVKIPVAGRRGEYRTGYLLMTP